MAPGAGRLERAQQRRVAAEERGQQRGERAREDVRAPAREELAERAAGPGELGAGQQVEEDRGEHDDEDRPQVVGDDVLERVVGVEPPGRPGEQAQEPAAGRVRRWCCR